jgi:pimeloyl-ACP methyl ester carboxylesterase
LARKIARGLGGLGVLLLAVVLGGLIYQTISEAADLQRYPPLGQMVDVGGYRLHLYCTGVGGPTVVLDGGLAGPALQWALVQKELEKVTRVCSYDRAGVGWSDAGPEPRTSQQMMSELHTLLQNANVAGPYVLVGHSLGGLNIRWYAHLFPAEVVGVALIAAGHPDDAARMPPEYQLIEDSNRKTYQLLTVLARFGGTRAAGAVGALSSFTSLLSRFPLEQQQAIVALTFYRPSYWATAYAELAALDESKAEVSQAGSLGDLPLAVLSGTPDVSRLPASFPVQQIKESLTGLQAELAELSSNSAHRVCDTCDHYIPMTNPALVVDVVEELLVRVRQ